MNKLTQSFRILAISLSTRGLGFFVLEGQNTLAGWGIKSVRKGDKNIRSLAKAEKLIETYQPGILVLQDVEAKGSRRAPRIKKLNRQIIKIAKERKLKVTLISGEQSRTTLLGDPKGTKQEMAELLAKRFPQELASRLPPKRQDWESEDAAMDIFDAAALAVTFRTRKMGG